MRKFVGVTFIFLLFIVLIFLVYGIVKKSGEKALIENRIATLPKFSFVDLECNLFSSDSINEGPLLIVKFHPECEHCQYEISEIFHSSIPFSGTKILFITNSSREKTKQFFSQFDKSVMSQAIILIDSSYAFSNIFGKDIVPSNYIYDRDLKLTRALYGEYKIEIMEKLLGLHE
ncbi:MAG TPA: hypothetical protein VMV47_17735 [Bacteroidales bacterium]|nr:hypothetical protein [Bacteroidales bacterium]